MKPFRKTTVVGALVCVGLFAGVAAAQNATISGTLKYTDLGGGTFDLRGVTVELFDSNVGFDSLLGTTLLGSNGNYSFNVPLADTELLGGNIDPYIKVTLDDAKGIANGFFVFNDSASGDPVYEQNSAVFNNIAGNAVINQTYAASNFNSAASLFNQLVQANVGAGVIRPGLPSINHTVPLDFPDPGNAEGAFYQSASNTINIGANLAHAWDVTLHEYGHFMADIDNLDNSPGGFHCFGISNITGGPCGTQNVPALGKDAGTRLGWSEGLANYLSIAIQDVGGFNQPAVPTVGDTTYTNRSSVPGNVFNIAVEANGLNDGEGDESSVMRILWDIADPANEGHDTIGIGHADLYDNLKQVNNLVRLDQVWDHFFNNPGELELLTATSDDHRRAQLGAIFEEYDVSPANGAFGGPFDIVKQAPQFNWLRNNDNANDMFELIIFNSDFTQRVLEIMVPGDVTSYALTVADRLAIVNAGFGTYQYVIAGTDTDSFATGDYWSGARSVLFVPEPGAWAIVGVLSLGLLRRRR